VPRAEQRLAAQRALRFFSPGGLNARGAEFILASSELLSPRQTWRAEGHVAVVCAQDVVGLSWLGKFLINLFGLDPGKSGSSEVAFWQYLLPLESRCQYCWC